MGKKKKVLIGNGLQVGWIKILLLACVALILFGCASMPTSEEIVLERRTEAESTIRITKEDAKRISKLGTEALTLEDCIRIGLVNNLEMRVANLEGDIANKDTLAERLRMLPGLTIDGRYEYRDKLRKSDVYNWKLDKDQKDYTVGELKDSAKANLSLTWNVLDTVLAYVRSGESKMYEHVLEKRRHRQAQFLALDITEAYWQAAAVEDALDYVHVLEKKLRGVNEDIKTAVQERILDAMSATESQMRLKELELTIRKLQARLSRSRLKLSQLMGLNQNIEYTLYRPPIKPVIAALPHTRDLDIDRLEEYALTNRPDLFESDMQVRIQKEEAKRAFWELFPGVNFFAAGHYDKNRLLLSNTWSSVGAGLGWNLLELPSRIAKHQSEKMGINKAEIQRIMLTVGVITQVHIALLDYAIKVDRFRLLEETYILSADLLDMAKLKIQASKLEPLAATQRHLEEMAAKLRRDEAVVDLIVAHKRLCVAVGIDPLDCDASILGGRAGGALTETAPLKRWKCTECGYIHTGPMPPEFCPICGADRGKFVEYSGEDSLGDLTKWKKDEKDKILPESRYNNGGASTGGTSGGYVSGDVGGGGYISGDVGGGGYISGSDSSRSDRFASVGEQFLWKLQVGAFSKEGGVTKRIAELTNADLRLMDPRDVTIESKNLPRHGFVNRIRFINLTQSDARNMANELKHKRMEYWLIPPSSIHW
ncbi:TolC family protein [Desulfobacterales bacterium HSG2]|nr:TolC family protein [Desulfobacterales bacterium HSG2]